MMKKSSIKTKVIILTVIAMGLLTAITCAIGYFQYDRNVLQNYVKYAKIVIEVSDTVFDNYHMGDHIAKREMGDEYEQTRLALNGIKDDADVKYLYSVYFEDINDIHSICYAINGKSKDELSTGEAIEDIYSFMAEPCEEDAFAESTLLLFKEAIENNDETIRYEESETSEYGRLVTSYKAVLDSEGRAVGILAADIDVNQIRTDLDNYLKIVVLAAIILTLFIIAFYIIQINSRITHPIECIAESTDAFVTLMKENVRPQELVFNKTAVKENDEIRLLSEGVSSLADGVKNYMINLESVTAEKERIGAELDVATKIQADMLPRIFPPFPERKEFELYATMNPAKEVGGDFYDFFLIDDDHLGLVMADVSGKGVPAALFMVIAKTLIKNRAQMGGSPSEVLAYANEQLCEGNEAELFVTVWFAKIQISTGKGIAANAGHEHPAIRRGDGTWELSVYKHSPAVATFPGLVFREHEFELGHGDGLFVYTDGVTESTNAENKLFGDERLLAALNRDRMVDPKSLLQNVRSDIDEFVGDAPQFDDITMLGITWT